MNLVKEVRFHISITVATVTVALVATLLFYKGEIPLILFIFIAGYVGGIINSYMRTRYLSIDASSLKDDKINKLAIMQVYVSPLISGLFGFIFYSLCLTGIIGGDLFPNFKGIEQPYVNVSDLFNIMPVQRIDGAKGVLWGFIAGFSERLVPNILDKITRKVNIDTKQQVNTDRP